MDPSWACTQAVPLCISLWQTSARPERDFAATPPQSLPIYRPTASFRTDPAKGAGEGRQGAQRCAALSSPLQHRRPVTGLASWRAARPPVQRAQVRR
eukprot:7839091-Pyramimonas_sp.AAC.1